MVAKLTIFKHIATSIRDKNIDFANYLKAEPFIETNSKENIATAKKLKDKNDIETIINTYDFIKENVFYK